MPSVKASENIYLTPSIKDSWRRNDIYISRQVLKTPGVETASEFRNTRDILSLLNSWIKSA